MIKATNLHKTYGQGAAAVHTLKGIDLHVKRGEFIAIMGRSGSGKSTLLHMLGLLDRPTRGELLVEGIDVGRLSSEQKSAFRLERLSYVFQEYSLVSELTLLENVYLPALCLNQKGGKRRAPDLLERVGLGHRLKHYPNAVSGGEQQRAAIARALAMHPRIMLFDEPTAALEPEMSGEVLEVMIELAKEGMTMLVACHETGFARAAADRIVVMDRGEIIETGYPARLLEQPIHPRTRRFLADLARARSCPFAMCML